MMCEDAVASFSYFADGTTRFLIGGVAPGTPNPSPGVYEFTLDVEIGVDEFSAQVTPWFPEAGPFPAAGSSGFATLLSDGVTVVVRTYTDGVLVNTGFTCNVSRVVDV